MRSFTEFRASKADTREADIQAKHFDTNEYDVLNNEDVQMTSEAVSIDDTNSKRLIVRHDGDDAPKGVSGLNVPRHMWDGTPPTAGGKISKKTGKPTKPTAGVMGMAKRNTYRANVYGSEHREPLSVIAMEDTHKTVLDRHFALPKHEQISAEKAAVGRLTAAKHLDSGFTTDESEKTDTILHETDKKGRAYMAVACKGVAGHTVYTSGAGDDIKHRIVNTCPGQTRGCGGGVDEHGVANTTKGTCFAPQAEAQYPSAAVRRAYLDQSKHDPKMTHDYILAHSHSIRAGAEIADKNDKNFVVRPNTLNENDRSTKHIVRMLNAQRSAEGKTKIISYQYSKTNELNDPENGVHVTHSNIGPKVIDGMMVKENVNRDGHRVNNTVLATNASGHDLRNVQGNKTPTMHSYLVNNLPRGGQMDNDYQSHAKHIKYWDRGTRMTEEEMSSTPKEGHFDGEGKPTTPEAAHHGFKVIGDRRYEYQKQHILHPRMTMVDGHAIPSDSRFKDEEHMPAMATRFKSKNGKAAGGIVVTTATTSTSGERSNSSFTHRIDQHKLDKIKATGEHEIDSPEEQEASRNRPYNGEIASVKLSAIGGLKKAGKKQVTEVVQWTNSTPEEAKFNRAVSRIAKLTDNNAHGLALEAGAKLLGHARIEAGMKKINKEHERLGGLNDDLYTRRRKLGDELDAHAKKTLSPEQYKKYYSAF